MTVRARYLGPEAVTVPLLNDRRVDPDEMVEWPGDVVDLDAQPPDGVVVEWPDGTQHALPFTLWAVEGHAGRENVAEVLARVGDDPDAARAELARERTSAAPRSTLLASLEKVAGDPPAQTPAATSEPIIPAMPAAGVTQQEV